MRKLAISFSAALLVLTACSSNDNNGSPDTGANIPVRGEFHEIQPIDVDAYIADFQAQRTRVSFTFDGIEHDLVFEGEDGENNALIASYGNNIVIIGFDLEAEEPVPSITLLEVEGESITNQWEAQNLSIESTAEEDIVYTGRLKDVASDNEFDVVLVLNQSLISAGTSTLTVSGTDAILNGDMGTSTYTQMRDMIAANPNVTRLIIQESSGSVNDAINVHTGRLIRAANLATYVPADGDINSGAVDLFVSGATRIVEPGGILGVHSWCCENGVTADQLPRNHPAHGNQLTYFREMLAETGEDFYFFTLQAAPFNGIHAMTRAEMTQFNAVTE